MIPLGVTAAMLPRSETTLLHNPQWIPHCVTATMLPRSETTPCVILTVQHSSTIHSGFHTV